MFTLRFTRRYRLNPNVRFLNGVRSVRHLESMVGRKVGILVSELIRFVEIERPIGAKLVESRQPSVRQPGLPLVFKRAGNWFKKPGFKKLGIECQERS